jgi:hypothetical protein
MKSTKIDIQQDERFEAFLAKLRDNHNEVTGYESYLMRLAFDDGYAWGVADEHNEQTNFGKRKPR